MSSNLTIRLWRPQPGELYDLLSDLRAAVVQIIVDDMGDGLRPVRSGGHDLGKERRGQVGQIGMLCVQFVQEGQTVRK